MAEDEEALEIVEYLKIVVTQHKHNNKTENVRGIENFSLKFESIVSSKFSLNGKDWALRLFPNNGKTDDISGYISVFLCALSKCYPPFNVNFKVSLMDIHCLELSRQNYIY